MSVEAVPGLRALAESYADALHQHFGSRLISVVLYGSVARGEATPVSDIDLLVVAELLPEGRQARNAILDEIDRSFLPVLARLHRQKRYVDLSVLLFTLAEARKLRPLYLDLVEDAILLYDRDHFFATILDQLRGRLEGLGARRLQLGRLRYWDLKPDYRWGDRITV